MTGQKETAKKAEKAKEEMATLESLAAPIVDWIREHHGPHTEVHISWDHACVKHDGMGIPFPYSETIDNLYDSSATANSKTSRKKYSKVEGNQGTCTSSQSEIFANLKAVFEEAVAFAMQNEVDLTKSEMRRSELIDLVIREATLRKI
ncbi:hypothetical protein D3C74_242790 [compost metagenome]